MGYMRAHAIIVDSWSHELIAAAHAEALRIFQGASDNLIAPVTDLTPPNCNGYRSFMVAPDGSKEGWSISDRGDKARAEFKGWLRSKTYEDGSTSLRWVEVMFADDDGGAAIIDHDACKKE
jgi:hypothetical protein